MAAIRHVLCASDFSPASRAAFARAVELARANRARLTVLHVIVPPVMYGADSYPLPQTYDRVIASIREHAQKELGKLVARAKARGVRAKRLLVEGIPHDRIVRAARAHRASVIVLGTHGRTGLARLFLGSVASRVIATAPCPVLTVRGRAARRR
jgi:nucleotide-binding universal stress UspA family protein